MSEPPEFSHELLAEKRKTVVLLLLSWLCEGLAERTNVHAAPRYTITSDGNVTFNFQNATGLVATAHAERITAIAKEMWLELRDRYPFVFYGEDFRRFREEHVKHLTADELANLGDNEFSRLFQESLPKDSLEGI